MTTFRDPIEWEESLSGVRPSSPAWRAGIKAFYGTELSPSELAYYRLLSETAEPPVGGCDEGLVVGGRRSSKSENTGRIGMFEALHGGHEVALAPGQLGVVAVISPLREQSQEILNYAKGLAAHPAIKRHVAKVTADSIEFKNGIVLKVMTCDAVAVVGSTVVCVIRDEWARWPGDEAAVPDREIENSLRPAVAPVFGAPRRRMFGITSAYIQEGLAYETEQQWFGKAGAPVLVLRGDTTTFNPNIDRAWLARERQRVGERVFLREYGTVETGPVWQPAITEGWFGAIIDACVDVGRASSPPLGEGLHQVAIDAAFKGDHFTVSVAHRTGSIDGLASAELDHVQAWKAPKGGTLSAEQCVRDVARVAKSYGSSTVYADQFAVEPLRALFAQHGITIVERPWTAQTKPQRFRLVRDAMTDKRVRLVDDHELIAEFHSIQGRLLRGGGESIEARRGHDDLVSSAVLALSEALASPVFTIDYQGIGYHAATSTRSGYDAFSPLRVEPPNPLKQPGRDWPDDDEEDLSASYGRGGRSYF